MSWSIAVAVGLANAVAAFVVTAAVGFSLMSLLNIHDREGGGSMGILLVYGPVMALAGLVWGVVATGIAGASTWSQFGRAFALAQFLPNAVVVLFFALKLITRPTAPTIDGMALELEAEVFIPQGLVSEQALRNENSRASLYAGDTDNEYLVVHRDQIALRNGEWVVPMRGRLNTKSTRRMLTFTPYDHVGFTLDMRLRSIPFADDTAWTEPVPMRKGILADGSMDPSGTSARYRVVMVPR